ncbi:MAG TPA: TetR family transcriptional regulator [Spirochaetota bacterium]|nr:TetR family transcriptional regulator [Spirochaetota bacterium]
MNKRIRAYDDKDKEARKKQIIEQALIIFNETAYQNIKIENIAKNTNIAKGTFFLYFKTKESLFLEITTNEFENLFRIFKLNLENNFIPGQKYYPEDFINFLKNSFSQYADRKILFRLMSITNVILEKNSDYKTVKAFKKMLYVNLINTGEKIEKVFNFVSRGGGNALLLNIYALIIGFQNITDSSEIAKEVIENENLTLFNMNFEDLFFSALKLLLLGIQAVS